MNLNWFRAFLVVKDYLNLSKAADSLFMSQSSLSKQIKSLESALNLRLFQRGNRGLTITREGESLIPYAEMIMRDYHSMCAAVEKISGQRNRPLRIAAFPVMHLYGFIEAFRDFKSIYPDIEIEILEMEIETAIQSIDMANADLAILRTRFLQHPDNYTIYPLFEDEYVLLCHDSHPFALMKEVPFSDAVLEDLVLTRHGINEYKELIASFGIRTDEWKPKHSSISVFSVQSFVSQGVGVSIVGGELAKVLTVAAPIKRVPFTEHPACPLGIVLSKQTQVNPSCNKIVDFLVERFADYIPENCINM